MVTRFDDQVSVLYGRCAHRGALMSDATVSGNNLICGLHGWEKEHPQPYDRSSYQGEYQDPTGPASQVG